jgi:stress-induced morphogen
MPISQEHLYQNLKKSFPEAEIEIIDLAGDDNHYKVIIQDKAFIGKSRISQHRMVNDALKDELLSETLHAMQLQTIAPESE